MIRKLEELAAAAQEGGPAPMLLDAAAAVPPMADVDDVDAGAEGGPQRARPTGRRAMILDDEEGGEEQEGEAGAAQGNGRQEGALAGPAKVRVCEAGGGGQSGRPWWLLASYTIVV